MKRCFKKREDIKITVFGETKLNAFNDHL